MTEFELNLELKLSGFPKRENIKYLGDKSLNDAKDYVNIYKNAKEYKSRLVYLFGVNGTQKTTMSTMLAKLLIISGYSVRYILFNELIQILSTFTPTEDQMLLREKLDDCDFLFIDEVFDTSKGTIYKNTLPIVDSFIRKRFDVNGKNICFISNIAPKDISQDIFGKSLKDLIMRSIEIDSLNKLKTQFEFKDIYVKQFNKTSKVSTNLSAWEKLNQSSN